MIKRWPHCYAVDVGDAIRLGDLLSKQVISEGDSKESLAALHHVNGKKRVTLLLRRHKVCEGERVKKQNRKVNSNLAAQATTSSIRS